MTDIPPMPPISSWSTAAFLVIVAYVCGAFVLGVARAAPADQRARHARLAVLGIVAWLGFTGALALSGFLRQPGMPPRLVMYFGMVNLSAVALAFSPLGARLASSIPIFALVAFHAFRLPLELVLHRWFVEGAIPVQMTFSGHNMDIITGIGAIVVGAMVYRGKGGRVLPWAFNIVGLLLLLWIMVIAVTSSPVPVRQYFNEPVLLLGYEFPYTWIGSVCVGGALTGHLLLARRLWRDGVSPTRSN